VDPGSFKVSMVMNYCDSLNSIVWLCEGDELITSGRCREWAESGLVIETIRNSLAFSDGVYSISETAIYSN
jgi:hypothetical protein